MIVNQGHANIFYENEAYQLRNHGDCLTFPFGWTMPGEQFPMFQIEFDVNPGTAPDIKFRNITTDTLTDPSNTPITSIQATLDGKWYVTWQGGKLTNECGYIQIEIPSLGYVSEVIHKQTVNFGLGHWYKLEISHSDDLEDIYYNGGYKQTVWFEAYPQFPELINRPDIGKDNKDRDIVLSQSQRTQSVLRIKNFPHYWIDLFTSLRYHDTITLTHLKSGHVSQLSEVEFTAESQDDCIMMGDLKHTVKHRFLSHHAPRT